MMTTFYKTILKYMRYVMSLFYLAAFLVLLATGNSCKRKNPEPELSTPTSGNG